MENGKRKKEWKRELCQEATAIFQCSVGDDLNVGRVVHKRVDIR